MNDTLDMVISLRISEKPIAEQKRKNTSDRMRGEK
jgi:hypothetical protein